MKEVEDQMRNVQNKNTSYFVELPTKVEDILRPRGGIEQRAVWTLFGIHSTK